MQVVIFSSPGRLKMLNKLKSELDGFDIEVINSKATFGKKNFWKRWELARNICLESIHDNYLIIPDDISKLDIEEIQNLHYHLRNRNFVCNVSNDGRKKCWNSTANYSNRLKSENYHYLDVGFFDCGGLTNRKTLELFKVDSVPLAWFNKPGKSSGVGHQITMKLRKLKVPMYIPTPSLCFHGDHASAMHKVERMKNPLITR